MRRFFAFLGIGVCSLLPTLSIAGDHSFASRLSNIYANRIVAAASTVKVVTGGTEVPVHVVGSVSSATAKVGDLVAIAASKDVAVENRIVIKKGAQGQGEIASVEKARGSGHSGIIGLKFRWIYAVDGGKIHLTDTPQSSAEEDRKGASSTATIVGIATFGIGGLFGHNFAHGKDVVLDEKKTLNAYIASNTHIKTSENVPTQSDEYDH